MRRFVNLFQSLDATTRTSEKVEALVDYFTQAPARDAAWAAHVLAGRKVGKAISSTRLRDLVADVAQLPAWLVEECYQAVGDLSETLALLLPPPATPSDLPLHSVIEDFLLPLLASANQEQERRLVAIWQSLDPQSRFVFHKLISTHFRVGAARTLLVRALAQVAGIEQSVMEHRLSGSWKPTAAGFEMLMSAGDDLQVDASRPYPFLLASSLTAEPESLGEIGDWQVEWKWDGVRAQLIRRQGRTFLVSRGQEHVGAAFPEIVQLGGTLPDGTVLDGEILAFENDRPLPFNALQPRLNRKGVEPMLFTDVPVIFLVYDVMEADGIDVRSKPLAERRPLLHELSRACADLRLSPVLEADGWSDIASLMSSARDRGVEGLVLKRRTSRYEVGRPRGLWWKLKVEPYSLDCVLVAAQPGTGKRAGRFTDYTFAVRAGDELVTITKAYSGLTDDEIDEVDRWIRGHIVGRYGPVRAVTPELVFELGFEGIAASERHKCGIALRFPRILRWRKDKPLDEIDTLENARRLLQQHSGTP
ncbi:MAG TPA: ATP-dependent DNA ligase [Tepidisphaeraceae bacterium]|nr:ATP-dependent DNA ligase [Tepidisphaeraceae bacterium]